MRELRRQMRISTRSAYAVGTFRNVRVQWESFIIFCLFFNLQYLPASCYTLRLYVQFLSRSFISTDSIRNYLSGVKTLHSLLDLDTYQFSDFVLLLTLRGLNRLKPHMAKRSEPITLELLSRIHDTLNFDNKNNIVYYCLFLFAFFLAARKSNLVPTSKSDIQDEKFLHVKDVHIPDNEEFLLVNFRWSKTIQFGDRELMCPLIPLKNKKICPISAFKKLKDLNLSHNRGALFSLTDGKIITYSLFQNKLRECVGNLDLDTSKFSTHSFRRGFATMAFEAKVPPEYIQFLGDWRSDAYKCYLELSWKDKLRILKDMLLGI